MKKHGRKKPESGRVLLLLTPAAPWFGLLVRKGPGVKLHVHGHREFLKPELKDVLQVNRADRKATEVRTTTEEILGFGQNRVTSRGRRWCATVYKSMRK